MNNLTEMTDRELLRAIQNAIESTGPYVDELERRQRFRGVTATAKRLSVWAGDLDREDFDVRR